MGDLEQLAIERLKAASEMSLSHYGLPLVITDSGGAGGDVLWEVCCEVRLLPRRTPEATQLGGENSEGKACGDPGM